MGEVAYSTHVSFQGDQLRMRGTAAPGCFPCSPLTLISCFLGGISQAPFQPLPSSPVTVFASLPV